jgi:hypothetical protein
MPESDSERGKIGSFLREISHGMTEIVRNIPETVGDIRGIVSERTEIGSISITASQKSFSVNQRLRTSVHAGKRHVSNAIGTS